MNMPSPMTTRDSRKGTVLIVVAGVSALLASLALAFLARMRSDVEESQYLIQYAQAKIMLAAACNYVQETSRLGWDNYPSSPNIDGYQIHEEAFGWVDVRDGSPGPKGRTGLPLATMSGSVWPAIGSAVRCPMHRVKLPPFATRLNAGFNLMVTDNPASPDYCFPLLKNPDPRPADDSSYKAFADGDKNRVADSTGRAWFRVYRDSPGTFIVTCGAGGSEGYKSWSELTTADEKALFNDDDKYFYSLRAAEVRLFYRIEWTAAVTEVTYHNLQHEIARATEHYETWPPNASHTWSSSRRTQTWMKNPVGTIRWIQRLVTEPSFW
jgi:hypothetical protein